MSDLFIPFNNNPESVSVKTGSYTVPTGKYARVTVSLSAQAEGNAVKTGANGRPLEHVDTTSDSMSKTATFFVCEGTVLTTSTSAANSTVSGDTDVTIVARDTSISSFSIDGTAALECKVSAYCTTQNLTYATSQHISSRVSGDVDARYIVEIYNQSS